MARSKSRGNANAPISPKEPVFIVKPALRMGGLDYLHVLLLIMVAILIALAISLAYFRQGVVLRDCQYGIVNGTCAAPAHNATDAIAAAEHILAGYAALNTSLALVPYYTHTYAINASYVPARHEWLVDVPYTDPLLHNSTYHISLLLNGSTLGLVKAYLESVQPARANVGYAVAAYGTISDGKTLCLNGTRVPVYLITDPYAPGALAGIRKLINFSQRHSEVEPNYYFVFTGFSLQLYPRYGVNETQMLGRYLACAAQQGAYPQFVGALGTQFNGLPMAQPLLENIASVAGLNTSTLALCIDNSSQLLHDQAVLASYYGVVATPAMIVGCKYYTLPQTLGYTLRYVLNSTAGQNTIEEVRTAS